MKMQKGLLFSLMAFLLVFALFSLQEIAVDKEAVFSAALSEENAFKKVSDKYTNVKNNSIVLTSNRAEKSIDERILPFTYSIDGNFVSFEIDLPSNQQNIDLYLENLNAFRVFLEDTNYLREFDSMHTDMNLLLPESWGGTDKNISFMIEPECLKFSVLDENTIDFRFVCSDYNYSGIRKHVANLTFFADHDFNSISCSFNGNNICFNSSFDPQNSLPYISISIDSSECINCSLPQSTISGHFNPLQESSMRIVCTGSLCTSPQIDLNFSGFTRLNYSGPRIDANIGMELSSEIEGIVFNDENISVEDRSFEIRRWGD